jgi:hypothetical protein
MDLMQTAKSLALGLVTATGTAVAGSEAGLNDNSLTTLATAAGLVVAAVTFIDKRIDKRLAGHTAEDNLRHDLILKDNQKGRHEMRAEIRHLRDLLAVAGVIPDHTPEAVRLPDESGVIPNDDETKP